MASRETPGWRKPRKIVVSRNPDFSDGIEDYLPEAEFFLVESSAEALRHASDADILIGFCTPELVAAAENLAWIQIYWAGVERCLAVDRVGRGEILLTNMQKMSSPTIGEHAIAMMLSLTRGLTQYAKTMEDGTWDWRKAQELGMTSVSGKTMLVVGLGGIGREIAKRASVLGMRVLATRNSSREGPDYVDYVGLSDELLELAAQADVVANTVPLTSETMGLYDSEFFNTAKRGIYFINVARGKSVVTDDLVAALEDGRVAGAGLDVTDPEPLPADHPLWQMPNVIITPHVAGSGRASDRHRMLLKENLRRYAAGEALLNVVDPRRGY